MSKTINFSIDDGEILIMQDKVNAAKIIGSTIKVWLNNDTPYVFNYKNKEMAKKNFAKLNEYLNEEEGKQKPAEKVEAKIENTRPLLSNFFNAEYKKGKADALKCVEWSEEDERNFQGIIDEIEANKNQAPDYDVATYDKFLSWLKSLKDRVQPQSHWKPSEEQMKALHNMNLTGNISYAGQGQVLIELYNDLKKL